MTYARSLPHYCSAATELPCCLTSVKQPLERTTIKLAARSRSCRQLLRIERYGFAAQCIHDWRAQPSGKMTARSMVTFRGKEELSERTSYQGNGGLRFLYAERAQSRVPPVRRPHHSQGPRGKYPAKQVCVNGQRAAGDLSHHLSHHLFHHLQRKLPLTCDARQEPWRIPPAHSANFKQSSKWSLICNKWRPTGFSGSRPRRGDVKRSGNLAP